MVGSTTKIEICTLHFYVGSERRLLKTEPSEQQEQPSSQVADQRGIRAIQVPLVLHPGLYNSQNHTADTQLEDDKIFSFYFNS